MLPAMLGTVIATDDGRFVMRFERTFRHPPEKVWRAITDPRELRGWSFPVPLDFDRPAGTRLRFVFPGGEAPTMDGEIVRHEPPRLLEYTWGEGVLRWELEPYGAGGCRLVFTEIVDDRESGIGAGAGWHAALEALEAVLDERPVDWDVWGRAAELEPEYARSLSD